MSTIFSPSACSWKPSNPQGKCSSHSKKQKGTIEESELVTSSGDRSQRRSISPPQPELFGGTHPSVHFCIFQRGVSCLPLFRKFFYAIFTRSSPRSGVPADWFAWPPFFFFFSQGKWRYSTCQAAALSSEKFDRSPVMWLGAIRPICARNETAWQGHNGNYFARHIESQSN